MTDAPIRTPGRLPDDVFRDKLAQTLERLESWVKSVSPVTVTDIERTDSYWRASVTPNTRGAAAIELLLQAKQIYSLRIGDEVYQDKPLHDFDLMTELVTAVEHGRVDRIETRCAMTGALEIIETRVELGDGWNWIGERRIGKSTRRSADHATVRRTARFLPYRR